MSNLKCFDEKTVITVTNVANTYIRKVQCITFKKCEKRTFAKNSKDLHTGT